MATNTKNVADNGSAAADAATQQSVQDSVDAMQDQTALHKFQLRMQLAAQANKITLNG